MADEIPDIPDDECETPESDFENDNSRIPASRMKRGDWAELVATLWLMELGFEVFRNVRNTGPIDLVAYKDGKTRLIDVKFMDVRPGKKGMWAVHIFGARARHRPNQKGKNIEFLYVTARGLCSFSERALRAQYEAIHGIGAPASKVGRPVVIERNEAFKLSDYGNS